MLNINKIGQSIEPSTRKLMAPVTEKLASAGAGASTSAAASVSSSIPKANEIPAVLVPLMKVQRWFNERVFVKKAGVHVKNNNRKYIDGLGVASIVAKDGLGCYLYVTQSMNNKDIPDDKRKFVAALDLTNGLLMIGFQILMFFTVSNKVCQTKMFDKAFGKMFNRPVKKLYQSIIKTKPGHEHLDDIKYSQDFNDFRGKVKDAFGGFTSLIAATIVGKRMLVPFIATPLAGKVEKKMAQMSDPKNTNKPEEAKTENNSIPAMKGSLPQEVPAVEEVKENTNTNLLDKYKK